MSLPSAFIKDTEPTELWANASFAWTKSLPDFLATDGWQLTYTLTPPSGSAIELAWTTDVVAAGAGFSIAFAAAKTSAVAAGGSGRLTGKVTKASDSAIVYDA